MALGMRAKSLLTLLRSIHVLEQSKFQSMSGKELKAKSCVELMGEQLLLQVKLVLCRTYQACVINNVSNKTCAVPPSGQGMQQKSLALVFQS